MTTAQASTLLRSLLAVGMGVTFALASSSLADKMWSRNESMTRHSRLLAMPRQYYLSLCRVGGILFIIIGLLIASLSISGVFRNSS